MSTSVIAACSMPCGSHIAGAARGSFNERFATPTLGAVFKPTQFPFSDVEQVDVDGTRAGLQSRYRPDQRPKMFYTNTPVEYWGGGRAAALTHTTVDGKRDLTLPDNVRIYLLAGTQHSVAAFPPVRTPPTSAAGDAGCCPERWAAVEQSNTPSQRYRGRCSERGTNGPSRALRRHQADTRGSAIGRWSRLPTSSFRRCPACPIRVAFRDPRESLGARSWRFRIWCHKSIVTETNWVASATPRSRYRLRRRPAGTSAIHQLGIRETFINCWGRIFRSRRPRRRGKPMAIRDRQLRSDIEAWTTICSESDRQRWI